MKAKWEQRSTNLAYFVTTPTDGPYVAATLPITRTDRLGNELDQDPTVFANCEICDGLADYDPDFIVCPACQAEEE